MTSADDMNEAGKDYTEALLENHAKWLEAVDAMHKSWREADARRARNEIIRDRLMWALAGACVIYVIAALFNNGWGLGPSSIYLAIPVMVPVEIYILYIWRQ